MPSDATDLALWDYEGEWSTAAGKLIIGQSDRGGVVRCGTEWKDYEVSFDAHVISRNLGVIVRAKDSENYEMIQITPENLSPHRRRVANGRPEWNTEFVAIPHSCDVSQAFSCTLTAKGSQIKMTINDVEVLDERTFLENRKGSIGFRCAGGTSPPERAEVCNIRVRMLV